MTTDRAGDSSPRVPPNSIDAEEGLLGSAILDPRGLEILATTCAPADFYRPSHRVIADVLLDQYAADVQVDAVTTWNEIAARGWADRIPDGSGQIVGLLSRGVTPDLAKRYAEIVHEHSILRALAVASSDIADLAYGGNPAATATSRAAEIVKRLAEQTTNANLSTLEVPDLAALLEGNLDVEDPTILTRSDGRALLYSAKMNEIHAEPSAGKTWFALAAALEVMTVGGFAIYVDWEDTARGILGRLLALGAQPTQIREHFAYVQPVGPLGPVELGELERLIDATNPDLVVLDGIAEALAKDGLDEGSNSDVVTWIDKVPRWITRTGAAVLMLDHVVKDREKGGRYSRGAGAKLAAVDGVSYEMKVVRSFSRTSAGATKAVVAKDRPGGVGSIGETIAVMKVEPNADGALVEVRLEVETHEVKPSDPWKPSILMQKVSEELERAEVALTASAMKSLVHSSKPKLVNEAVRRLIAEGYVREARMGRTVALHLVKPYRHDPDEPPPPTDPPPVEETPEQFTDEALFGEPDNVTPGPWPGTEKDPT